MDRSSSDSPSDLARWRREYRSPSIWDETVAAADWPTQFADWLAAAVAAGEPEPNAMTVATADAAGRPSTRTVLLRGFDAAGFRFFTNLRSRKATEARANPYASLLFYWPRGFRQVVVCGAVTELPRPEAEAYFRQRPRGSQLGAWASPQSEVLPSRQVLDDAYAEAARRFGDRVPMPPHWGGLRVVPETVEFWQGRPDRLHDRLRFRRVPDDTWVVERLGP